jgi:protein TonB
LNSDIGVKIICERNEIVKGIRRNSKSDKSAEHKAFEISDFDDLVFENRNKEYGAYRLRKSYYLAILTGILAGSLMTTMTVVIPFLIRPDNEKVVSAGKGFVSVRMENLKEPEEIYIPPPAPPPEPVKIQETVKYVPPEIVDSIIPIEKAQISTDEIISSHVSDLLGTPLGSGFSDELISGGEGVVTEEPFFEVEVMPSFRGGDLSKFREWVGRRTNYPQAAIDEKIRGTVFLTFIVEKDGTVSNVTVVKGVNPILDEEAVKAISESPKWSPGLQRGQPVRVRFLIPLVFMY